MNSSPPQVNAGGTCGPPGGIPPIEKRARDVLQIVRMSAAPTRRMPTVLLHGYPFDHTLWEKVLPLLPGAAETPDLPGFGAAPVLENGPSIDDMATYATSWLSERGIDEANLIGFSMGGYVALAVAEKHPERIAALGLINSQPFADMDEVRAGRRAMIERVRREGVGAASKAALQKLFAPGKTPLPDFVGYVEKGAASAGVAGITWALEAMARRPDRTHVLQKLRVPRLIVHSAEDQFIPVSRIRDLAAGLPDVKYVEVAGAGHCTPLESPDEVAKGIAALIDRAPK